MELARGEARNSTETGQEKKSSVCPLLDLERNVKEPKRGKRELRRRSTLRLLGQKHTKQMGFRQSPAQI